MPFIVRVETGYMDRDQYKIAALYQPGEPWTARPSQAQFNHKLLVFHGASCGVDYQTGTAPRRDRRDRSVRTRPRLRDDVDGARLTPATTATSRCRPSRW